MGHEVSITEQDPEGRWHNRFGPGNLSLVPTGTPLPGEPEGGYPSAPVATKMAEWRSRNQQGPERPPAVITNPVGPEGPRKLETVPALLDIQGRREAEPQDLDLRDEEHRLFSQHVMEQYGPVLGSLIVGTSVPSYTGIKAAAQADPRVGQVLERLLGYKLTQASPAQWREIQAGLSPVTEMLRRAWRGR